jgi:hypothetical protein
LLSRPKRKLIPPQNFKTPSSTKGGKGEKKGKGEERGMERRVEKRGRM